MTQVLEEINLKISTQIKLLELIEKETERLITRNNKDWDRDTFTACRIKLEKLQEFKYWAQEVLLEEGQIGNLEEWLCVM